MIQKHVQQAKNRYVLVIGTDFSEASASALREGMGLASRLPHPEIHVVNVVVVPTPAATVGAVVAPELAYFKQIDESAKALERWLTPCRADGLRLAGHIRVGDPAREIAQLASDVEANVIVVGTNSRRGVERFLLGSVSEALVRRAPCAVLTCRSHEAPAWEAIEPPCPDCVQVREQTQQSKLWCARHSEHHVRAHTYYEYPSSYGIGAQSLRS